MNLIYFKEQFTSGVQSRVRHVLNRAEAQSRVFGAHHSALVQAWASWINTRRQTHDASLRDVPSEHMTGTRDGNTGRECVGELGVDKFSAQPADFMHAELHPQINTSASKASFIACQLIKPRATFPASPFSTFELQGGNFNETNIQTLV
ncbi:hypothetical protein [Magnetospirillum sp. XM-1]|uniref:hypothetical protein n=1 Tax=Magnetospirillum sp. XM-1 TaxID=1663591 RepID=UPI0012E367E5|nr:hypothetical protein [Magnetospirillum sp. XM-1]